MTKYLFIIAFAVVYALFGNELGYSATSPLYTHFTYMFQHAGVMHLILNSLVFIGAFDGLSRVIRPRAIVAVIIVSAVAASFLSEYGAPTVGASSMIYAMVGGYMSKLLIWNGIKIADVKRHLLFLSCLAIGLVISLFRPGSNFLVHLYSLILGFALFTFVFRLPVLVPTSRRFRL